MKNIVLFLLAISLLAFSCNRAKQTAKDAINKTGETVGKGVSEFADGVKEGVTKTFGCELKLSKQLAESGLGTGKFSVEYDSTTECKVVVYFIFDKDFSQTIKAKVFDPENKEYGRTSVSVSAKAGEAKFIDFLFDKRTDIESRSTILFE
ncbi:MAG: hypothetical protein QM725_15230 [Lacibacter sp.]